MFQQPGDNRSFLVCFFFPRRDMRAAETCVYGKVWSLAETMVAEGNFYRKYEDFDDIST